jgi:Na+-translocating ferredoxin:NAD+ oxidoreductase RnfD subunit
VSSLTARPARHSRRRHPLRGLFNFARSPKGILLGVLTVLLVVAAPAAGGRAMPEVALTVAAAAATDLALLRCGRARLAFPGGALLSGFIVGLIIAPTSPWNVAPATAAIAVFSKHLIRTRWSNVFNPAALALVASFYLFQSEQSWWGSLPYVSPLWVALLLALGLFVASRVNKLPLAFTFLAATLGTFTVAAFAGDAAAVAEIFRPPDINALLFFATLMLTDPPTSPAKTSHQVWFGLVAAAASSFAFLHFGALWFLAGGLLVANALESARRVIHRRSLEAARRRDASRSRGGSPAASA